MTGKDFIIYILQNNLFFNDLGFIISHMYMTKEEAACKFGVGIETIQLWYDHNYIQGLSIGNDIYISKEATDPRHINMREI